MQISVQQHSIITDTSDCIVVNLFEGVTTPAAQPAQLTPRLVAQSHA